MAQAQPGRNRSSSRPGGGQRPARRSGRERAHERPLRSVGSVTELEPRREEQRGQRRQAAQRPQQPQRSRGRRGLPTLPVFLAGLGLGYGLTGPLPHLAMAAVAGLHPTGILTGLVTPAGMGNRRIVVMGTDHVSTNTDVMMTVQLKNGRTEVTQVPRDTFIDSARYGTMKANSLYSTGGVDMVKQELTKLLSAPVDRYLIVNLDAVRRLADAMGGVVVDVPKRLYYVDNSQGLYIDLYPGRQLLKGEALEGFLRFRHDELGDIGRMERQKLVLAEVFHKLANPAMVTRIPELMKIAGNDIRTDLSPVDIGTLLTAMATTKLSASRLSGVPYWHDDISYWMPDINPNHNLYRSEEP